MSTLLSIVAVVIVLVAAWNDAARADAAEEELERRRNEWPMSGPGNERDRGERRIP